MDIKIDKNVPIPIHGGGVVTKYAPTVRALEVGDSFWIPKDSVGSGFPAAVKRLAKDIGISTMLRTVTENDVVGWRVWRIEKVVVNGNTGGGK